MGNFSFCIVVAVLMCACQPSDTRLEGALRLAKGNRPELEKVLRHYQGDSLKLEAAKFLIRHMPGHYSLVDSSVIHYYDAVDSTLGAMQNHSADEIKDSLESVSDRFAATLNGATRPDVEIITADYLIRNIDSAFVQWREGAWAVHLDFDRFCEYLLPYKADNLQTLDDWRGYLKSPYDEGLENLLHCDMYKNSAVFAAIQVNTNLKTRLRPVIVPSRMNPVYRLSTRVKLPFGMCSDYAGIATSVLRSNGIPVAFDFTPQWPFRAMGHTWNVVWSNDGKNIPFGGVDSNPGDPHKLDERMAKVFRKTYAANPALEELQKAEEYIPATFKHPFIKDVTEEYTNCADVELEVEGRNGRFAYLTVFNNFS